ncbi:TF2H4 factor, partial [Erpornis zantholeuca]|nr:TF2H4 factor [Erpornis zantholeuca]
LQCKNLQEFLRGLSPSTLDRLYGHPATCLAVFRELPGLAQAGIMRMLFLEQPLPQAAVGLWVKKEHSRISHFGVRKARAGIWGLAVANSGPKGDFWDISQTLWVWGFSGGVFGVFWGPDPLRSCDFWVFFRGKAWSDDTAPLGPDRHARDVPALDKYAEERWEDYSVEGMSESLLTFLQHLREFGLVFQRKVHWEHWEHWEALGGDWGGLEGTWEHWEALGGTDSELQVALIALFSELLYRFPNLVVAQVTRDSVQAAIANGITAEQIIHFLRTRAHPVMAKQTPVLPPTITDQIRLWELERDRLRFSDGVLYNQFLSQVDFEVLRDHARGLGVLVFENPARRLMVVTPGGHPDVKRFWKRQKHN